MKFFLHLVFKIQCVFYTHSASQFGLAIFEAHDSHGWLMATVLEQV